jgi:hypothetical protein
VIVKRPAPDEVKQKQRFQKLTYAQAQAKRTATRIKRLRTTLKRWGPSGEIVQQMSQRMPSNLIRTASCHTADGVAPFSTRHEVPPTARNFSKPERTRVGAVCREGEIDYIRSLALFREHSLVWFPTFSIRVWVRKRKKVMNRKLQKAELDTAIVKALVEDSHKSYRQLARECGVSINYITEIVQKQGLRRKRGWGSPAWRATKQQVVS